MNRRVRIFFHDTTVMDYRASFYTMVHHEFDLKLFLSRTDTATPPHLDYTLGKAKVQIRGTGLTLPPLDDVRRLFRGIVQSDVFVSWLVWNSYTLLGIFLSRLLKRKVVLWEEINIAFGKFRFRIWYTIIRILWRYADAFFVTGEVQKAFLMRCGVDSAKIFVANEYPGHIYSEVEPHEIKLPFGDETRIVLYLGRLIEVKGVQYLIRAFSIIEKEHENVALLFVGSGSMREHMEALSRQLAIKNIRFAGYVSDINVKAYLFKRSSIVVVPSISLNGYHEGGPMVVVEALSAGKPVVCTDVCPHRFFIRDGVNGYVVQQKNVKALAEKIGYLLDQKPITPLEVLSTFRTIKTHEYQVEQFKKAIGYALMEDGRRIRTQRHVLVS